MDIGDVRLWMRKHTSSIICYSAYVIAYAALSWATSPHVFDNFPDSHTYLTVSFLGHAERLWTIPVLYFFGASSTGRVILQIAIGVICWIVLAVQLGRVLRVRTIRIIAQALVLLTSLCAPVIQWNRIVLSESITISLTVLLLATSLALARRMDMRALASFLFVAVVWTFSRQVQAFIIVAFVIPFLVLAWRRPKVRRLALIAGSGIVVIGIWGTLTTLQTSSVSPSGIAATNPSEVQLAGIIQFRVATDPGELSYFYSHGLPHTSALKLPPPFTRVGQPVNVNQFADPYAEYRLADDPGFKRWADQRGRDIYLKYLATHPSTALIEPFVHAASLMTMNPDYISTLALPSWASTIVYGNRSSAALPNTPSGAPRSSDSFYGFLLVGVAGLLFCAAAVRHRMTKTIWVSTVAFLFAGVWFVAVWDFAATELPRELIETAVLFHVSMIALIAAVLDSLFSGTSPDSGQPKREKNGGTRAPVSASGTQ